VRIYLKSMRRLASMIALLVLISAAAPLLACMTGTAMSAEESACCRAMHGNCGEMAKMGCCRTEVRTDDHPQLATMAPPTDIYWAVIAWLSPFIGSMQHVPSSQLQAPKEHSPPGLLIAKTAVLRI